MMMNFDLLPPTPLFLSKILLLMENDPKYLYKEEEEREKMNILNN